MHSVPLTSGLATPRQDSSPAVWTMLSQVSAPPWHPSAWEESLQPPGKTTVWVVWDEPVTYIGAELTGLRCDSCSGHRCHLCFDEAHGEAGVLPGACAQGCRAWKGASPS